MEGRDEKARAARKKAAGGTRKQAAAAGGRRKRKAAVESASRGLGAREVGLREPPAELRRLAAAIEADGGSALAVYREPLGGHWVVLAALPLELVERTPHQRDVSPAHVARLAQAIERVGRFLDPVLAIRVEAGGGARYQVPNGGHRLEALRTLGARALTALVVPEAEIAWRILALNTEKAHQLRERALEVVRMARELARIDDRPEKDFAEHFEEPALLTLGLCYEQNGRFSGGAYQPVLKRVEAFLGAKLSRALVTREARRDALFALDEKVVAIVAALKERGLESPYLKSYVIARLNPLRFGSGRADFEPTLEKMLAAAKRFDPSRVRADQLARTGGAPAEE